MKNQMILAVEQKNLARRSRQLSTKRFRELYGRKSASNDNNSYRLHSLAPMTRVVGFHFPWMRSTSTRRKKHSVPRARIGTKQHLVYRKRVNSIGMWLVLNSQSIASRPDNPLRASSPVRG